MNRFSDTVILFFAHSAKKDLKRNCFRSGSVHRKLIEKLYGHTTRTIRNSNLPVLHFSEENQRGADLAERLTMAVADAFAQGYDKVIAIGNDTPDLEVNHLWKANRILRSGGSVLGPSADGGNYLIGISKHQFNEVEFCKALSNSQNTHEKLKNLLGQPEELEILIDIDDEGSLTNWLHSFTNDFGLVALKRMISAICAEVNVGTKYQDENNYTPHLYQLQKRGPPALA
jgi:glycosyltransferase A (GT-A) superfamily protein (DUF2064 family)